MNLITFLIALWGALLSSYSAVSKHLEKARRLRVALVRAPQFEMPNSLEPSFRIEAVNPGERTVTIQTCVLRLKNGGYLSIPTDHCQFAFPHDLEEGKTCRCWVELGDIARELHEKNFAGEVKLAGEFWDSLGKQFRSKWTTFRIGEWLETSEARSCAAPQRAPTDHEVPLLK